MTAFDLQGEFDRYRAFGGRAHFVTWCARYGEDYDCDAEWLADDYLRIVRRHENADTTAPTFREWLASESDDYRSAHMWGMVPA